MAPLTIRTLMSNAPPTIRPQHSVKQALDLMRTADVAELLVVDDGRLVGTVSQQDIWQHCPTSALLLDEQQADDLLAQFRVGGVMTLHPPIITPETPLSEAAHLLTHCGRSGLPVVEQGTLVGFLRGASVMQALIMLVRNEEVPRKADTE